MGPILIELSPNRLLLDSNFDGYKLSLREIDVRKKELAKPVDRILLNSSQYSLLHTKLYGLHNHIIGDLEESESVYFIDNEFNVCKTYLDPFNDDLIEPIVVWKIPITRDRKTGDYNVTLKFANKNTAVLADGTGIMYILNTGLRNDDDIFTSQFSDNIIGSEEGFVIIDVVSKVRQDAKEELHVVLLNIKQSNINDRFMTNLYWVSFIKEVDHWQQTALRELCTKGGTQYVALEKDCTALYVVSDSGCKFTINSDNPIKTEDSSNIPKVYNWTQTIEEITIRFPLSPNIDNELVNIVCKPTEIDIEYNHIKLLNGPLYQNINSDLSTWCVENNYIEVILQKNESGVIWPELVKGDKTGEYILDTCIVQEVQERLGHVTSDTEAMPQCGTTFNSQQVEECDFETDKMVIFERLSPSINYVTHKIHLGSHQVLMTVNLSNDLPPTLGIRHDVDVCLWQPQGDEDDFSVKHEGTLLAFGYIQASKQNRKFSVCPPDMSYSVICESSGHLFIYRQKIPVSTSELRNRSTGRRINTIAEQQVVNVSNDEVIGIYATNNILYLLCESSVKALKL